MNDLRSALKTALTPPDLEERERQAQHHQQVAAPAAKPTLSLKPDVPAQPAEPARKPADLQNVFLNAHCGKRVAVYLLSGIRLSGILKSFDMFTMLIEHEGAQQLVLKHAVSTIGPDTGQSRPAPSSRWPSGERRAPHRGDQ